MRAALKKTLRIAAGILFLVLGVAGLFLPVLQGIIFIIVGLVLLAPYSPFMQRRLDALRIRYPRMYNRAHAFNESAKEYFKKLRNKHR